MLWNDLTYRIDERKSVRSIFSRRRAQQKAVFESLNGYFESGQLTAILGPSGAGKTTLLECVIQERSEYTGEVFVEGTLNKINIAYVPQFDRFYEVLTARECLEFAAKMYVDCNAVDIPANYKKQRYMLQRNKVDRLLAQLGLVDCAQTTIAMLSGGQRKRLSIAQELVRTPNVIVLDEPTSELTTAVIHHHLINIFAAGLDSNSTLQLVDLLSDLAHSKSSTAVVASIHQPSFRVINKCDRLYAISSDGRCMFSASPKEILPKLKSVNESFENNNPVDVLMEVSAGCRGQYKLDAMVRSAQQEHDSTLDRHYTQVFRTDMKKAIQCAAAFNWQKFFALITRNFKTSLRDPLQMPIRFLLPIVCGIGLSLAFGSDISRADGCPPDLPQMIEKFNFKGDIDFEKFKTMKADLKARNILEATNQVYLLCCVAYVFLMNAIPAVLLYPTEKFTFRKETRNGAYSSRVYYFSNLIASTPLCLINATIFSVLTYSITGYPKVNFRFTYFLLIMLLNALISETLGLMIGSAFTKSPKLAIFAAPLSLIPLFIFSGHLINLQNRGDFYELISSLSFIRHSMDGLHIALYGFRRCTSQMRAFELIQHVFKAGIRMTIMDASDFGFKTSFFEVANNSLIFAGKTVVPSTAIENVVSELVFGSVAGEIAADEYGHIESAQVRFFNLKDNDLWDCFDMLVTQLILFRLIAYYLVAVRGNK